MPRATEAGAILLLLALPGAPRDPEAVRRYVFDGTSTAAEPVPNLAGDRTEPLVFAVEPAPGAPRDEFRRCADGGFGGVQIHGGKDNLVENNLFVECKAAVSFSPWGPARWKQFLEGHAAAHLREVRPSEPPYAARYPDLARLQEDCDVNFIRRNVAYRCDRFLLRDPGRNERMENWRTEENPGLEDPAAGRYGVKEGSPLWNRLSFRPIPFGEIGLYRDAYRKGPLPAR